jgi:DNA polymerase III subunit alpha
MSKFTHLHVHSHYSLLEAIPQIEPLVARAKSLGMTHLALTDSNNMYGAIEFYKECKANDIVPIIGVEINIAEKSMSEEVNTTDNRIYKMVLLAKNNIGYRNLLKLVSFAHIEPKGKVVPCLDLEKVSEYKEGLSVLSGLTESYLWEKLRQDDTVSANKFIKKNKDLFGKEFYIEIGNLPNIEDGSKVREATIKIAKENEVKLIASYNVHYLGAEDRSALKTLMAISNNIDALERHKRLFEKGYYNLYSEDDAAKHFADIPEAVANAQTLAEECNLEIELGKWVFPDFKVASGLSPYDELRKITFEGFEKRRIEKDTDTLKRVEYELSVIESKGYTVYLLIVADLLHFAKANGIYSNIRGSVSGSMVTFLSGITNINPIEFEVPFERFLNPERPSAPDIDMDFADTRRDEVIAYAADKYGHDRLAQIGTFGTMAARAAVRDVARAMKYPYMVGDRISKLIPLGKQGRQMTFDKALEESPEFKKEYEENRETKEIVDTARTIEGNVRHMGVHAAGVVISPTDLYDFTPIQYDTKGEGKIITQYDMYSVEEAGLLKFDFLGLGNLSIIADAVRLIKLHRDIDIDIDHIPLDDKKTFEMLSRGETVDTFQMNGGGMTKFLMELRPSSVNDINAMVALYRPGPLQFIPEFIKRKNNPELIKYMDDALEPILAKTYGILVYQDDLLMMAIKLAGYTWGEVDKFRKAVGKKILLEMAEQKEKFIKGCISHSGWDEKKSREIWSWIEPFASYGFNKAHSVSYGRVAYNTAYLKANFPAEYMTAVLNSEEGEIDKVTVTVKDIKRIGIIVLPPDINESTAQHKIQKNYIQQNSIDHDAVQIGMNTIKHLGSDAVLEIVKEREANGKYKNLSDFLKRINAKVLNKKSIEALIKSGSLDHLGERGQMLANIEVLLAFQQQLHNTHKYEVSLFGEVEDHEDLILQSADEAKQSDKLFWERELLGFYISGHPLDPWREVLSQREITINKINEDIKDGVEVTFAGIVTNVKYMLTKRKEKMAFVEVQDLENTIETVMFPKTYEALKDFIVMDTPLAFRGKVSYKEKEVAKDEGGAEEVKVRDDGTEAKVYGNKSVILDEIRRI